MISKGLLFVALLGSSASAENLRGDAKEETTDWTFEALDLEVVTEGGKRELFPLLPGTKCPTGHQCRVRTVTHPGMTPMASSLKNTLKSHLAAAMDWNSFNDELKTVVASDNYCSRRGAMRRAAGMAAGLTAAAVSSPAFAAETKEVKMGADSGLLVFVPAKLTICTGDTVKWINNKAGPHNVVFDEEAIPAGVDQEAISMIDDQLGEEGETFSRTFNTKGDYAYYCEPHRGAGMNAMLTVM